MLNIIIGKRSNLSRCLFKHLDGAILVSSQQVVDELSRLDWSQINKANLILNQFQPATLLNNLDSPVEYIRNSIVLTADILEFVKDKKLKINKVLYTSSSSVYGSSIFCNETDVLAPLSLHATLKLSNERLVSQFCKLQKIDFTIARVFNMYGGNDEFSIISKIIKACNNYQSIRLINNGKAIRDFIHIDDVVKSYKAILLSNNIGVVNVASGRGEAIENILDLLYNRNIKIDIDNVVRDEIKISIANNAKLKTLIESNYRFKAVDDYVLSKIRV